MTELAYILDRSGSMESMKEAAIAGFNQFLRSQRDVPGDVNMTLVLFDDEYMVLANASPLESVEQLTASTYVPRGSTALLDAIGRTITEMAARLEKLPITDQPGKVIVAIFTDGLENASVAHTSRDISAMIRKYREEKGWEFIFLAANQDAIATASEMQMDIHTSSNVTFTAAGVYASKLALSRKIRAARMKESGTMDAQAAADDHATMEDLVNEEEKKEEEEKDGDP